MDWREGARMNTYLLMLRPADQQVMSNTQVQMTKSDLSTYAWVMLQ